MSYSEKENREEHLPEPMASYENAETDIDKVTFILAGLGKGKAEDVVKRLEEHEPEVDPKLLIATVHQVLTELYENGKIKAHDADGSLVYSLIQK
jgi:Fe2+ or Zn2+ uptake regulation protein